MEKFIKIDRNNLEKIQGGKLIPAFEGGKSIDTTGLSFWDTNAYYKKMFGY